MANLEQLIDGPSRHNRIVSNGADGLTLVAERATIDDPTSGWKLTLLDKNEQPTPNDPPFKDVYTNRELSTVAYYGRYTDWRPEPIDFKLTHSLDDRGGYRDGMTPKY